MGYFETKTRGGYRSMAFEGGHMSGQLRGDINMTPLIDVLLVLLIIFMVIAPAIPHCLNAALPQRSVNPTQNPDTPLVVQIMSDRDGLLHYKINQDNVSLNDLGSRLSAMFSVRANKAMCIRGATILISQRSPGLWISERALERITLD